MQSTDECRAQTNAEAETEEATPRREAEATQSRNDAQRRRAAEAQRPKPAEFRAERERENTSWNAGEKRSYIGSARACGARGGCSHAHIRRDAHQERLRRAVAQGARVHNDAHAAQRKRAKERHVMKDAYNSIVGFVALYLACNL